MIEIVVSFFVILGATFALIGSIGLARLPDFFSRLHGPTKSTTLGVGALLAASIVFFTVHGDGLSLHEILIALFLYMTAPVSAHLVVRAALHRRVPSVSRGPEKTHGHPKLGTGS
jgi:multicomponent K+:H+ antiporter subunit G